MQEVDFTTAITFGHQPRTRTQTFLEGVDDYFFLGGRKASVILGNVAMMTEAPSYLIALKVATYFTIAIPLIMLLLKALGRALSSYFVVDVQAKLEAVLKGTYDDPDIRWYSQKGHHNLIFSFRSVPGLIFKLARPDLGDEVTQTRFANIMRAQEICRTHNLNLLVIPKVETIRVNNRTIIVERFIPNLIDEASRQEELHQTLNGLDETTRQLTEFIIRTGWDDVDFRNLIICDTQRNYTGNRRIVLFDLESMENRDLGLFGRSRLNRRGLIHCLPIDRLRIAEQEAARHHIQIPPSVIQQRQEEIADDKSLDELHRHLPQTDSPIQADVSRLDLPTDLQPVARDAISFINTTIAHAPRDVSTKRRRLVHFHVARDLPQHHTDMPTSRDQYAQIFQTLQARGLIHSATFSRSSGEFTIQA